MHIKIDVNTEIEIKELTDLPKLKIFMESLNMKINKSKLARDLNVDRRTIDKYLNGYQPSNTRKRKSKIDNYLRKSSPQSCVKYNTMFLTLVYRYLIIELGVPP